MPENNKENQSGPDRGNAKQDLNNEGEKRGSRNVFSGKKKFLFLFFMVLFPLGGLGLKFEGSTIKNLFNKECFTDLNLVEKDDLTEKMLGPFIVPIPPDSRGDAVRIDFSVIWDGLGSIRFENRRLHVRYELYHSILDLAGKNWDLRTESDFLEKKMAGTFRKILEVQNLAISIKDIRYF